MPSSEPRALYQRLYRYRSGFYRSGGTAASSASCEAAEPLNMLDIASNSRPPTTDTTGAASANINNQVSITPHLCPTAEPHELLSPLPIPSQPLPKPNCSTRVGVSC